MAEVIGPWVLWGGGDFDETVNRIELDDIVVM